MSGPGASYSAGYAREEQVTGEGVAVELPVAGLVPRIAARLLDMLATASAALALYVLAALAGILGHSEATDRVVLLLVLIGVVLVLPVALELGTRGRSLGKLALGLRTVRDDGGPITGRQSIGRALAAWVEIWLTAGAPALLSALLTPRAQRLGDLMTGTYVISERYAVRLPDPPTAPAGLEAWARSADIAALPGGLSRQVRQFLDRATGMEPSARALLGNDLLARVLDHVAPPPPPGWHPEYVLAAVLADRRRRDGLRLAREQALRDRYLPSR